MVDVVPLKTDARESGYDEAVDLIVKHGIIGTDLGVVFKRETCDIAEIGPYASSNRR